MSDITRELFQTVAQGDHEHLRKIVTAENMNVTNDDDDTLIQFACSHYKRIECLRVLLEMGADPILKKAKWGAGVQWHTLFGIVCIYLGKDESQECIKMLLEHGLKPNSADLRMAATSGWPEDLLTLIRAGADMNGQSSRGQTALILSIKEFRFDNARVLLEEGADPDITDEWGWTALMHAQALCTLFAKEAVPLLFEFGADPDITNLDGQKADELKVHPEFVKEYKQIRKYKLLEKRVETKVYRRVLKHLNQS